MPTYTYTYGFEGTPGELIPGESHGGYGVTVQAPAWPDTAELFAYARYGPEARTGATGLDAIIDPIFSNKTSFGQVVAYPPFDGEGYTPPILRASAWFKSLPAASSPPPEYYYDEQMAGFPVWTSDTSARDGGAAVLVIKEDWPDTHLVLDVPNAATVDLPMPSGWFEVAFTHDVAARQVWLTVDGTQYGPFENLDGWAPYFDVHARVPNLEGGDSGFVCDDLMIEWQVTDDLTVVRQWPRDDGEGMSSAPRLWPPSPAERIFGGYQ